MKDIVKRKIIVEFEINTDANEQTIETALLKGVVYGLDIKRVCMPADVNKFEVKTYIL